MLPGSLCHDTSLLAWPPAPRQVYSECPSYDELVPALLERPIDELPQHVHFKPGVPVKPMLAKPTTGAPGAPAGHEAGACVGHRHGEWDARAGYATGRCASGVVQRRFGHKCSCKHARGRLGCLDAAACPLCSN